MSVGNNHRPNALVLFDIDGTLIRRAGPHHRQALIDAVQEVAGVETTTDHIPVQGMLDRDIIAWMLRDAGIGSTRTRALMPAIVDAAQQRYQALCPDLRRKVCPGAAALLRRLQRARVPAGLVTGNLTLIGWRKMEAAGLREFFCLGAFAELARDRAGLARIAIRQARRDGLISKNAAISLVGDHPNDVRAARANGIRAVAVGTGVVSADELRAAGPDLFVPDMRALRIEALLAPLAARPCEH
jgi:phosphoglycolate phosphatase